MVDPYDDPKTTAAMCDAIDDAYPVTTLEQQAVPVAQEDIILAKAIIEVEFDNSHAAYEHDVATVIACHRLSHSCKSGEGAGVPDGMVSYKPSHPDWNHAPKDWDRTKPVLIKGHVVPSMVKSWRGSMGDGEIVAYTALPDATQTREAEVREAAEALLLAMTTRALRGRDHVPSMRDEQTAASALRAALNARGAK